MSQRLNSRMEARRSRYKVAVDADEGRRRREDMVEIRKNKREESLLKERREGLLQSQQFPTTPAVSQLDKMLENLPCMISGVCSNIRSMQYDSTKQFRELLSIERNPPIEKVIQSGVVSHFVKFLARDDFPKLQFEAAWALTNIASGTPENTKVVIDYGSVPIFIRLLSSADDFVRDQAVWALGNIASGSPKYRDCVLGCRALKPLLRIFENHAIFEEHANLSMLRNATRTLLNFCRGRHQPEFEETEVALPTLAQLIHLSDEEVVTDACWALSYLSDGINYKIKAVIEAGVCPRLVELLRTLRPSSPSILPALRTIGNIVTGEDNQTQVIIDCGALPCLRVLLASNYKKSIRKEACRTISNITAGNRGQIQAVIDAGIINPLVDLLQNAEIEIKEEAAWAISNATSGGNYQQIKDLVKEDCIGPLCDLLVYPDPDPDPAPRIVRVCLEGLENILMVGEADKDRGITEGENSYAQLIERFKGPEKIRNSAKIYEKAVKIRYKARIYEKAVKILETYWLDEEEQLLLHEESFVYAPPPPF